MGNLLPGRPWMHLPHAARLYYRRSQLPAGEPFQTKTALAVAMLRQADVESAAPLLGVVDRAYAVDAVARSCLEPAAGQRRIEIVTRLRAAARWSHPAGSRPRAKGGPPKWGARIAAPHHHVYWPVTWQPGQAWVYGRMRRFQYKQLRCRWAVSGPQIPVPVLVVQMAGYQEP